MGETVGLELGAYLLALLMGTAIGATAGLFIIGPKRIRRERAEERAKVFSEVWTEWSQSVPIEEFDNWLYKELTNKTNTC